MILLAINDDSLRSFHNDRWQDVFFLKIEARKRVRSDNHTHTRAEHDRYLALDKADDGDPWLCDRLGCHYVIRITQDCHAGSCQLLEARVSFGLLYSGKQCSFITLHGIHSATADASDEGFKHLRETLDALGVTCKSRA